MIVYRLCKSAHAVLDGEGARLWGGRWNTAGRPMVYTAGSPSLAVLEILVHLDLPAELLPDDMVLLTIDLPDHAAMGQVEVSPREIADCREIGDAFLREGASLALRVSSIVVPQEANVLLNPRQSVMASVTVAATEPFRFDPRLFG